MFESHGYEYTFDQVALAFFAGCIFGVFLIGGLGFMGAARSWFCADHRGSALVPVMSKTK
jgi:hypothetical protein